MPNGTDPRLSLNWIDSYPENRKLMKINYLKSFCRTGATVCLKCKYFIQIIKYFTTQLKSILKNNLSKTKLKNKLENPQNIDVILSDGVELCVGDHKIPGKALVLLFIIFSNYFNSQTIGKKYVLTNICVKINFLDE